MKDYIEQFYSEGLAIIFYVKPIKYLEKKIKNNILFQIIKIILKIIYTLVVLGLAFLIFKMMI